MKNTINNKIEPTSYGIRLETPNPRTNSYQKYLTESIETSERRERSESTFPKEGSFTVIQLSPRSIDDRVANLPLNLTEEAGIATRVYMFGLQMIETILDVLIARARTALE
jgi:hypothetical protein